MVSTALCRHHATAPATRAAISFALPASRRSSPGIVKTTAGTTIAVTIATGTCLSACASRGGISRRANKAMNDSRAVYVTAPTAKIRSQIVSSLSTFGSHLVAEDSRGDSQQAAADHRQPQRHRIERDDGDGRNREDKNRDPVAQQRHQHRKEAQRHDEFKLPRRRDDLPSEDACERGELPDHPQQRSAAEKIRGVGAHVVGRLETLERSRERLIREDEG